LSEPGRSSATGSWIYGAPVAAVGLLALAILYPGLMSSDSVDQWSQALGPRALADWHPVLDTLWIRLWSFAGTPAVPIAVQVLLLAVVVASGCRLQRAIGIPRWIVTFEALALPLRWPWS